MKNLVKEKLRHFIYLEIPKSSLDRYLIKLYKQHISVFEILEKGKNVQIRVLTKDLENIKQCLPSLKIEEKGTTGIYKLKENIKKYRVFFVSFLFGCLVFFLLNHMIVDVVVVHQNREIREILSLTLEEYGIKKMGFKKSYQELQEIKEKILEEYPDRIEWLEIENVGMKYYVRVEERILTEEKQNPLFCHIVSKKDAIVTKVIHQKGEALVHEGMYVNKGDILITGEVKVEEEVKDNVCAQGSVFGEVWYEASIRIPKVETIKEKTKKVRYNFLYEDKKGKHVLLKPRVKNYIDEPKKLFSLFGITFYFTKQVEQEEKTKILSSEEALEKGVKLVEEKTKLRLSEDEKILSMKVLEKHEQEDALELHVFLSVEEHIDTTSYYEVTPESEEMKKPSTVN